MLILVAYAVVWLKCGVQAMKTSGLMRGRDAMGSASEHAHARGSASEHAPGEWRMALAFANVGLTGTAASAKHWVNRRRPKLLQQFTALLQSEERPAGLLLNEVGNLSDLLVQDERQKFSELLTEAFHNAGASEHGPRRFSGAVAKRWLLSAPKCKCNRWRL